MKVHDNSTKCTAIERHEIRDFIDFFFTQIWCTFDARSTVPTLKSNTGSFVTSHNQQVEQSLQTALVVSPCVAFESTELFVPWGESSRALTQNFASGVRQHSPSSFWHDSTIKFCSVKQRDNGGTGYTLKSVTTSTAGGVQQPWKRQNKQNTYMIMLFEQLLPTPWLQRNFIVTDQRHCYSFWWCDPLSAVVGGPRAGRTSLSNGVMNQQTNPPAVLFFSYFLFVFFLCTQALAWSVRDLFLTLRRLSGTVSRLAKLDSPNKHSHIL